MLPLAAGISLDLFVVACMIIKQPILSAVLGALRFGILIGAWFVFPRWRAPRAAPQEAIR